MLRFFAKRFRAEIRKKLRVLTLEKEMPDHNERAFDPDSAQREERQATEPMLSSAHPTSKQQRKKHTKAVNCSGRRSRSRSFGAAGTAWILQVSCDRSWVIAPGGRMANDSETSLTKSTEASNQAKQCQASANESDDEVQGHLPEKEEALSEENYSQSKTPSPLLDFDKDNDDDHIFPEPIDPLAEDDEVVDLLIEQATLLSRTFFRYLMVMPGLLK